MDKLKEEEIDDILREMYPGRKHFPLTTFREQFEAEKIYTLREIQRYCDYHKRILQECLVKVLNRYELTN